MSLLLSSSSVEPIAAILGLLIFLIPFVLFCRLLIAITRYFNRKSK